MDTMSQLLDIVTNANTYKTRIETLQAEQDKLIKLIETHAKIADVDRIVAAANKTRDEAVFTLETAQKRAKQILDQANKDAVRIAADAEYVRSELTKQAAEVERIKADLKMELDSLNSKRKQVNSDLQMAADVKKAAEVEFAEMKAKYAKLKAALS